MSCLQSTSEIKSDFAVGQFTQHCCFVSSDEHCLGGEACCFNCLILGVQLKLRVAEGARWANVMLLLEK